MNTIPHLLTTRCVDWKPESPILRRLREWRALRERIERSERQYEEAKRRAFPYKDWEVSGRDFWDAR